MPQSCKKSVVLPQKGLKQNHRLFARKNEQVLQSVVRFSRGERI